MPAEAFDTGGYNVSFFDTNRVRESSSTFRAEEPANITNKSNAFDEIRYSSGSNRAPGGIAVTVDGVEVGRAEHVPWTGGWNEFAVVSIPVDIAPSDVEVRTLRWTVVNGGWFDVDQFRVVPGEQRPVETPSAVLTHVDVPAHRPIERVG